MDLATKDTIKKFGKILSLVTVIIIVVSIALVTIIVKLGLSFFVVNGDSMYPYFEHGDAVVLKQSESIHKGDIVFFNNPENWEQYTHSNVLVKRIVAVTGDEISFDNGILYVNNNEIFDTKKINYECKNSEIGGYKHTLTDKEILVKGDNHNSSLDSLRILCNGNTDSMYIPTENVLNFGEVVIKL